MTATATPAARICHWCDQLDDPALGMPCPCSAYRATTGVTTTYLSSPRLSVHVETLQVWFYPQDGAR